MLSGQRAHRRSWIISIVWTTVGIVSGTIGVHIVVRVLIIVLMLRFFLTRPMAHLSVSLAADNMRRQSISALLFVMFLSFRICSRFVP